MKKTTTKKTTTKKFTINTTLLALVAAVIIAGGAGYLIGYVVYSTKTHSLEDEVFHLNNEVASLETEISTLEDNISTLVATNSTLEDDVSTLEDTILTLEATISELQDTTLQEQLDQATAQLATMADQLSGLQERLNSASVTNHFEWYYRLQTWELDLPISLLAYIESKERPRPTEWSAYVDMAKDTKGSSHIYQVVYALNEPYLDGDLTELQTLDYVITFIMNMPYIVDNIATPYDGIPRYPLETLFEREGDSEDTSILVAGLLYRMGYDVALLVLEDYQHMAVGVSLSGDHGSYYEYNGKKYFYLETTQLGWSLGDIPSLFEGGEAQVFPLSD